MFFQKVNFGLNDFWRYFVVLLFTFFAIILSTIPLIVAVEVLGGDINANSMAGFGLNPNLSLVLNLLTFVIGFFALWGLIKFFHKRSLSSVLTGRERLDWSRIFFGGGLWLAMILIFELGFYFLHPQNYEFIFNWQLFLPLLAICLLMLPLQTSFEELLFRGYLMQGIGSISRYRWIPLLVTSVLFGVLHLANPEVGKFGLVNMIIVYISTGLVLGVCTIMDEGTELALGMHAVNNLFGALFLTFEGSVLETPAVFKTKILDPQMMAIASLVGGVIFVLILSRKYKWTSFKKLLEPIKEF